MLLRGADETIGVLLKWPFKAAIAIALAELINMCLYFDRGYWIVLTAMVLTTQTWGESVKRALERVGMTILGGATGTALYFSIPEQHFDLLLWLMMDIYFFHGLHGKNSTINIYVFFNLFCSVFVCPHWRLGLIVIKSTHYRYNRRFFNCTSGGGVRFLPHDEHCRTFN